MMVSYCLSWPDLVFDIRHQYATVFASLHFCSVRARTLSSRIWSQPYLCWWWYNLEVSCCPRVLVWKRPRRVAASRQMSASSRQMIRALWPCNTNLFWVVLWPGCSHARKLDETRAAMRTIKKITCDETSSTSYFSFMIIQPCDVWGSASPWSKKSFRRTP